jgi:hypothetical protein
MKAAASTQAHKEVPLELDKRQELERGTLTFPAGHDPPKAGSFQVPASPGRAAHRRSGPEKPAVIAVRRKVRLDRLATCTRECDRAGQEAMEEQH